MPTTSGRQIAAEVRAQRQFAGMTTDELIERARAELLRDDAAVQAEVDRLIAGQPRPDADSVEIDRLTRLAQRGN